MCIMLTCPFQMLIPCLLNLEDPLAFLWVEELCPRIARLFSRSRNRDIRSCFSKADRIFYAASGSNTCSLALIVGVYNMYNLFASILSSCFRTDLGTTYTSVIHCSQVISWIFEEESCLAWGQSIWTIFAVPTDNKQGLVQRMVWTVRLELTPTLGILWGAPASRHQGCGLSQRYGILGTTMLLYKATVGPVTTGFIIDDDTALDKETEVHWGDRLLTRALGGFTTQPQ